MNLPQSIHLPTKCLSRVFDKTVATYKYYWFLRILEYIKEGKTRFNTHVGNICCGTNLGSCNSCVFAKVGAFRYFSMQYVVYFVG